VPRTDLTSPKRLRAILEPPGLIPSFAAHDVFTALILERAGIPLLFVGGFGAAASSLGLPDFDLLTRSEMADIVRRVAGRVQIPVVADGDTGYGDLIHVQRTVRELERAGAAGIILEDQVAPKRCGHFQGKAIVPWPEMRERLLAALDARRDPDFVLIARTDARTVADLDEAIDRGNRARELGADVVFIEAPESREELERIAREVPGPLMVNLLIGGRTPILHRDELQAMGYKIAVYPIETLAATQRSLERLARALLAEGRCDHLAPEHLASFDEIKDTLGLPELLAVRARLLDPGPPNTSG
jgi:2,3-dimethylmalate lyase